ncbi:hypothetical protein LDG_6656 [Legionella drancourtii LLAP12]|uniref:Uncharacterized protein n=1 Tax=Legionella drancourtii LLAP12 TaxID=658187 RepID=G9EN35_9GAMM|nr:hypothetical protein LDG_6656 [Legionella drancourtii LLAP12]
MAATSIGRTYLGWVIIEGVMGGVVLAARHRTDEATAFTIPYITTGC